MTNKALYSVLRFLGLNDEHADNVMSRHLGFKGASINDFEEIRHHELKYIFPKSYQEGKTYG